MQKTIHDMLPGIIVVLVIACITVAVKCTERKEESVPPTEGDNQAEATRIQDCLRQVQQILVWARDEYPVSYVRERIEFLQQEMEHGALAMAAVNGADFPTAAMVRWQTDGTGMMIIAASGMSEANEVISQYVAEVRPELTGTDLLLAQEEAYGDYVVYTVMHELVHYRKHHQTGVSREEHRQQEEEALWEVFQQVVAPAIRAGHRVWNYDQVIKSGFQMYLVADGDRGHPGWQAFTALYASAARDYSPLDPYVEELALKIRDAAQGTTP